MMCLTWKGPRCPNPDDSAKCASGNWFWYALAAVGVVSLLGRKRQ